MRLIHAGSHHLDGLVVKRRWVGEVRNVVAAAGTQVAWLRAT
jgi:hypothetical protein